MNKQLSLTSFCVALVFAMTTGMIAQETEKQSEPLKAEAQPAPQSQPESPNKNSNEPPLKPEKPQSKSSSNKKNSEDSNSDSGSKSPQDQEKEAPESAKTQDESNGKPTPEPQDQQDKGQPEKKQEGDKKAGGEDEDGTDSRSFSLFRGMYQDPHREKSKRSKELAALVKPLVLSAEASTVKILNGSRLISLGTVVDRDGLILTKASELRGDLKIKLSDGRQSNAMVVGVHEGTDLALLKVEWNDLQPIHWGQEPDPVVGQWIASPVLDEVQLGVIGVNARKISPSVPFIGIMPALSGDSENVGAKINSVSPNTPADKADLMVGDTITKIDEVEIKDWAGLRKTLGQYDPNDEITLTIQRGKEELKIKIVLGNKEQYERENSPFPQQDRSNMQNSMGSRPSQRRKDFPMAFQHDLGLNKTTCGGPVVNLDGQVIGINIARAGRVDSLALPVNTVLMVLDSLKSGDLAPAKVNQSRLAALDKELGEIVSKLETVPKTSSMENQLLVEKARKEELDRSKIELEKALEELENRLKVVELKKQNYEKELRSINTERNNLARKKLSLERERQSLSTGVK